MRGSTLTTAAKHWPTPHANSATGAGTQGREGGLNLQTSAAQWTTPQAHDCTGGNPDRVRRHGTKHGCANLADDVTQWPTARGTDGTKDGPNQKGSSGDLMLPSAAAQWGTPTGNDYKDGAREDDRSQLKHQAGKLECSLQAQQTSTPGEPSSESGQTSHPLWGTPRVSRGMNQEMHYDRGKGNIEEQAAAFQNKAQEKRRLNPRFSEWLMGLPEGWVNSAPVERTSYDLWETVSVLWLQQLLSAPFLMLTTDNGWA